MLAEELVRYNLPAWPSFFRKSYPTNVSASASAWKQTVLMQSSSKFFNDVSFLNSTCARNKLFVSDFINGFDRRLLKLLGLIGSIGRLAFQGQFLHLIGSFRRSETRSPTAERIPQAHGLGVCRRVHFFTIFTLLWTKTSRLKQQKIHTQHFQQINSWAILETYVFIKMEESLFIYIDPDVTAAKKPIAYLNITRKSKGLTS